MKRFFCTECNRVIRARRIPASTLTPKSDNVTERIGICNYHDSLKSRNEANDRVRFIKTVKTVKSSTTKSTKKGGK